MNPYGGQNPGPHPGGYPSGQPSGYPAGQPGARPGQWQGGYPPVPPYGGHGPVGNGPVGGGPVGGGNGGGGDNKKGLIIALVAIVAVLAVAGAVGLGLALKSDPTSTASPVTFSGAATTTTAGAPTTGGGAAPTEPATESDGFLTTAPKTTGSSSGQTVQLKLSATGSGAGAVIVVGVRGGTVPTASTLPWEWQGTATIGDTMTMIVTGTGPVSCTIVVNGQDFTESGQNRATCSIRRVATP
ncbi:hypothetical protein FK268_10580 [Tsukamurella sputi]|uniref:Uncharacterized protein n=1 Tax=Tsukamurella sputi TaxID=2591848 RepID=A0A5C5RM12_9ACTN|nr:hypothetical protein [Tsukamurella sputi]TWS24069.1 hypothetical protein FK268_10580 [Tsukamurella sputi]